MLLAHGGAGGGSGSLRFLLLMAGFGALTVGVRLRATVRSDGDGDGSRRPWLPFAVGGLGIALVLAGVLWPVEDEPDIHLTVLRPAAGSIVPANQPVTVEVRVEGGRVADGEGDSGGRLRVSVDGRLQSMPSGATTEVTLPPGRHVIEVELTDERHASYDPPILVEVPVAAQ